MKNLLLLALLFSISACKTSLGPATVAPKLYNISEKTEAGLQNSKNAEIQEMISTIAPYKAQLDSKMNRQLSTIKTPLVKGSPESNLGNWMADVMMQAAKDYYPDKEIAFAATNSGGIRVQEIGTGPLLVSEIYELMPFDNTLLLVQLSGKEVKAFLAHIASSGGWPVSEELVVKQTGGKMKAKISGEEILPNKMYYVATIDYVANGGSGSTMLKGKPQVECGQFLRDVLIEYAEKTPVIDVVSEGKRMRLE